MNTKFENYIYVDTAVGVLTLAEKDGALALLCFGRRNMPCKMQESPVLHMAKIQLEEYFANKRTAFCMPLELAGTAFQKSVWQALMQIPCGDTRAYGDVALMIGNPGAARAVGNACNKNPVAIIVPCHRVTAAHGIGGFGGSMEIKKTLLNLEKCKMTIDLFKS